MVRRWFWVVALLLTACAEDPVETCLQHKRAQYDKAEECGVEEPWQWDDHAETFRLQCEDEYTQEVEAARASCLDLPGYCGILSQGDDWYNICSDCEELRQCLEAVPSRCWMDRGCR